MKQQIEKAKINKVNKYLEEYTDEEKVIIRKQFFPQTATVEDMVYCINVAKQLGLNPLLKEIYFIERKAKINGNWVSKIEPMLGRNSYLTIAHRTGKLDGIEVEHTIAKVPKRKASGEWVYVDELVAQAKVYRKDMSHPIKVRVVYDEYVQKKRDGTVTQFWAKMPVTMLEKVAESQALRKAFNIRGALDFYENISDVDEEKAVEIVNDDKKDAASLLSKNAKAETKVEEAVEEVVEETAKEKVEEVVEEVVEEYQDEVMKIPEVD